MFPGLAGTSGELTALQQSMLLLAESLESGAICGQFEQVRKAIKLIKGYGT